jgi:hypothetical protein
LDPSCDKLAKLSVNVVSKLPFGVDALTFGRKVQPARERRLFDMMTVSSLPKQVLKGYHVEGKMDGRSKSRPLFEGDLISEVARLKLSTSFAGVNRGPSTSASQP